MNLYNYDVLINKIINKFLLINDKLIIKLLRNINDNDH